VIVFGGILPDVPIFIFYGWAKLIAKIPEGKIWSEAYYYPIIQDMLLYFTLSFSVDRINHCLVIEAGNAANFCLSLILHSLFDLPVHHDDAHRHFFPFSDYRFISPISYWDPKHYGNIVTLIEIILVLLGTIWSFSMVHSPIGKGLMILVNGFYGFCYFYFYLYSKLGLQ
jgi:hypothetical protein